ncbi:NAD(P)H-binding protein [Paraliomyxa miuraensis]|uniref:NAD(P)H-binding protein n=1 Tax=Paraliomyxa miuraensis TaxID=376150 RepID=UPI00225AF7A3|nr:NAD(P)H-binding protein [Paraliomyxa miuraensis]MCX4248001.1 NAD(P)H-binding protein [Paraliomyxa miuraensis]
MNVVIFGASGMIGMGVLLELLDRTEITRVLSVGRRRIAVDHPRAEAELEQIVHEDFEDFEPLASAFEGLDACLWCLGTASGGMDEATYTRITHDFTMAAAKVLHARSPGLRFCFVSGAGTDDTEQGRAMWARVKGKTENALRRVGFGDVVLFRPAFIRPMRGTSPRGALYRTMYAVMGVFYPLLRAFGGATSTVEVGRAMIAAAMGKAEAKVLDSRAINALAATLPSA